MQRTQTEDTHMDVIIRWQPCYKDQLVLTNPVAHKDFLTNLQAVIQELN